MNRLASKRSAAGLSLIELMIAMLIGLLLILGVVQIFGASRTAYQLSEGLSRTQENGRFAMDYLQRDLRMVGHFGCINDQSRLQQTDKLSSDLNAATYPQLDFARSLQGYDATSTGPDNTVDLDAPAAGWSPALPAYISNLNPRPGSDIVELRFLSPDGAPVTAISANTVTVDSSRWSVLQQGGVTTPVLFGLGDCTFADVFQGTGTGTVTAAGGLNALDAAGFTTNFGRYTTKPAGTAMLYRAEALVYYVAMTNRGVPALFRARFNGAGATAEELVEGIESLQFLYGMDAGTVDALTGNITRSDTAATLGITETNWRRVGQIQVGLLASSPDRAASARAEDANAPHALGVQFTLPSDARFRASYEATVALRNRLYGN
ncbi:MAG: PilW family protein [Pseudoxanthomonas sp.]